MSLFREKNADLVQLVISLPLQSYIVTTGCTEIETGIKMRLNVKALVTVTMLQRFWGCLFQKQCLFWYPSETSQNEPKHVRKMGLIANLSLWNDECLFGHLWKKLWGFAFFTEILQARFLKHSAMVDSRHWALHFHTSFGNWPNIRVTGISER